MQKEKRKFEGVWIPKNLWLNKELTLQEKVFFVEINSLDNEDGCFASNAYFADFFRLTKGRVSQIIKSLIDKKLLSVKYIKKGKMVEKRVLRILNTPPNKTNKKGIKKTKGGSKFPKGGYLENDKDNSTERNNTTNKDNCGVETPRVKKDLALLNKRLTKKNKKHKDSIITIVNYFKQITGRDRISYSTKGALTLMLYWLNEGKTIEDFKKVIDYKTETLGKEYHKIDTYCRRDKFEDNLEASQIEVIDTDAQALNDTLLAEPMATGYKKYLAAIKKQYPNIKAKHLLKASQYHDLKTDKTLKGRINFMNDKQMKKYFNQIHKDWGTQGWLKNQHKNIFEYAIDGLRKIANAS